MPAFVWGVLALLVAGVGWGYQSLAVDGRRRAAVRAILRDGDLPGSELRDRLAARGFPMSGPGFYQFMARMERDDLVQGWWVEQERDGVPLRARWYRR